MTTLSGILQAPDGTAIAGAKITFEAVRNYEQVTFHASSSLTTGSNGSYSVTLPIGSYNVLVNYGNGRVIDIGMITILSGSINGTLNDYLLNDNDEAYVLDVLSRLGAPGGVELVNGAMDKEQNLNDVEDKQAARANLSIYSKIEIDDIVAAGSIPNTINADTYTGGLVSAIATGKNVIFSNNYNLGSSVIQLSSGQKITSLGGAITFTGSFCLQAGDNNLLDNLIFIGNPGAFAVRILGANKNLTIRNPRCTDCSLFKSSPGISYDTIDWVNKTNVPRNVSIINPVGEYTNATQSAESFIVAQFIDGVTIIGGRAKAYKYGMYYWGGDSDPASQGSVGNQRKADNILVIGFVADNCWMAGLWGSMGILTEFNGCSAFRDTVGGDVGFDHEGTITAKTIGCHARNYQNGNYASFFFGKTHDITGCSSVQMGGYPHYRNYNSSSLPESGYEVNIAGCMFRRSSTDTTNTLCTVDGANGPANKLSLRGNFLGDTRVTFTATNNGDLRIEDNDFRITTTPAAAIQLIRTHANYQNNLGDVDISGNVCRLDSGASWVSGSTFIYLVTSNFNQARTIRVWDNKGPGSISMNELGGNSGISGYYHVYNNVVTAVNKTNGGSKAMTLVRSDNNYTALGALIATPA